MKTIGLMGGMSWESSAEYYRVINEAVREKLGGLHSAKILMYSLDFAEMEELQAKGEWEEPADMMIDAAQRLERGGADFFLICTNTMHKLAPQVASSVEIPLLHIADATAAAIKEQSLSRVGLLGTRFTMEQDFYKGRLVQKYGLQVLIPGAAERQRVHDVIYDELCMGKIEEVSRQEFRGVIEGLVNEGAEGIILGCTEIPLLVKQEDSPVPLFDTTTIHARTAVEIALGERAL